MNRETRVNAPAVAQPTGMNAVDAWAKLERAGQGVRDLLRGSSSDDAILEGRWRLEEIHDLLGALASEQPVPELSTRLGRIRDSLAGHLVAAVDCGIARVRPEVIADMLCRGAVMVSADLDALA